MEKGQSPEKRGPPPQRRNPAVLEKQRLQTERRNLTASKQRFQSGARTTPVQRTPYPTKPVQRTPYPTPVQRTTYPAPPVQRTTRTSPVSRTASGEDETPRFRDALFARQRLSRKQKRVTSLLCLLYAFAFAVCFLALNYPLNVLTARIPFPVADFLRLFLPSLAGTVLCSLTRLLFPREPRMTLFAFRKLFRWLVLLFVALQLLLWGEWDAQRTLARFALLYVCAPLAVGTAAAVLLFYRDWLYEQEDDEDEDE